MAQQTDKNKNRIKLAIIMMIYTLTLFFIIGDNEWHTGVRLVFSLGFFFVFWMAWSILNDKM
jgi:hypothetical protein